MGYGSGCRSSYGALRLLWLAGVLSGLCLAAQANTTAAGNPQLAQNGAPATAVQIVPAIPAAAATSTTPATSPLPAATVAAAPIRMALLLPLHSATLGPAALALRDGFLAGYEREKTGVAVEVVDSGDTPAQLLSAYAAAVTRFDLVVGPLSRSAVAAVARSGNVIRPTIALAQPQTPPGQRADEESLLPPRMLVIGLSLEDEARQIANWISAASPGASAFVVATDIAWQKRTARAFVAQARQVGVASQSVELSMNDGALSASGLAQLQQRIATEQPSALFVALDARQARQLRLAVGADVTLYGTSQLNPLARADWLTAEPLNELNGARLVDLPWQLQADHPAVMVYPRPVVGADQSRSADLERLYALGIDAYRVAREIAAGNTNFELDGVSGKLAVSFGNGAPGFQRSEQQALYRGGKVQPLTGAGPR